MSMVDIKLTPQGQKEKALRNIINGKNARGYIVGAIQARMVKVLLEEGVEPTALMESGLVRPVIKEVKPIEQDLMDLVK